MSTHNEDNLKMLEQMAESGIDLTKPQSLDFFAVFKSEEDAGIAFEELAKLRQDVELEIQYDEELEVWELIVAMTLVPTIEAISEEEQSLDEFVQPFEGYADGWGIMQLDPDEHIHDDECGCE